MPTGGREVLRSVNPIRNRAECKECHGAAEAHPVNGILIVDHDTAGLRRELLWAAAAMSSAGLIVVLLGMGINWLVLRRHVLQPIAALDRASRALSAGKLHARVPVPVGRVDEMAALSTTFNGMAEMVQGTTRRAARAGGLPGRA